MKNITYIAMLLVLGTAINLSAQEPLFQYIAEPQFNAEQQKFVKPVEAKRASSPVWYFKVSNFEHFKKPQITLNLPDRRSVRVVDIYEEPMAGNRSVLVGNLEGMSGSVILAPSAAQGLLTGTVFLPDKTYAIHSLTGGLFSISEFHEDDEQAECTTKDDDHVPFLRKGRISTPIDNNLDGFQEEEMPVAAGFERAAAATGECQIRVLVAYTSTVADVVADPLGLIFNAIAQTNQAYANSGIGHRIELARVYETTFNDAGLGNADVRAAWTTNGDGQMDEVHTERNRWRADMCALIMNVGTGMAWIDTDYDRSFSVTNWSLINNRTFQHELGHNFLCRHDPNNDSNSSPFHGYGHPGGIFRTIMAYPSACGEAPCTRVNEFSGPNNLYYDAGTNQWYVTGNATQNNVRAHNENSGVIVDHETVPNVATYSGDYNIANNEAVYMAANETFGYSGAGSNQFDMFSGSDGSFRAGGSVVLGVGFRARSGSTFRAYIENCAPLAIAGQISQDRSDGANTSAAPAIGMIQVAPNPAAGLTTLTYTLPQAGTATLELLDLTGRTVYTAFQGKSQEAGTYSESVSVQTWAPGIYFCRLTTPTGAFSQRLVVTH